MQTFSFRVALVLGLAAPACGGDDTVGSSNLLTGTYQATLFVVTPTGQAPIDVLAAGGSLSISIAASGATSGTLSLPASVTGGAALSESMAGTASITALTVHFTQDADTFVRDLTWLRVGTALTVVDQPAGAATFSISLAHQ
ncbi:MAG TPA: hypothetical protein VIP80_04570 [Gemmatimonadales bacterium]|jgi:hypothetical protein